jgi:hypothetical protein
MSDQFPISAYLQQWLERAGSRAYPRLLTAINDATPMAVQHAEMTYLRYSHRVGTLLPIGYWRLAESGSSTAADSSSFGRNGTYNGGYTQQVPSLVFYAWSEDDNKATTFNGTSGYVSVPHAAGLSITTAVSVEAWFQRTKSGAVQPIVGKGLSTTHANENYSMWINASNELEVYFGNGSASVTNSTKPSIDTGIHHAVGTYDGATLNLWLDNGLASQDSVALLMAGNSNPLRIAGDGTNFFGGTVDEVAIYNTDISTEVDRHYKAGVGVPVPIAYAR